MRHPQHHQVQALNLCQVLLRRQFPLGELEPGLEFVRFFPRHAVGSVYHAGAEFDEALDVAFRRLAAHGHGQVVGAYPVHLIFLRVASFAAAVEDVIELLTVGAVEDAW